MLFPPYPYPPVNLSLCPHLYFWRHVPFNCPCGTKPGVSTRRWNRSTLPFGVRDEKAAWDHLGTTAFHLLFWTRTRVCIEHMRDIIWQNRGSFSMGLLKLGPNPVSPPLWLPVQKPSVRKGNVHIPRETRESQKQSWDSGSSIRSCLLLLNCKKWMVSLESAPVQMQSIDQVL